MNKGIYCDMELCMGCGACIVACMDENDVNLRGGTMPNRRVYTNHQVSEDDKMTTRCASVSCMHCDDSPCLIGCPTGAIYRDIDTDAVMVEQDLCIGCHSCALACPFGVPRYDGYNKLTKCDLCADRVAADLTPACVRVCPVRALVLMDSNEASEVREGSYIGKLIEQR